MKRSKSIISMATFLAVVMSSIHGAWAQLSTAEDLTLEEALLAREASNLPFGFQASASGNFVAWIDRGNVRIAHAPDFKSQTIVSAKADSLAEAIYLSPDGKTIIYITGQRGNCLGEMIQPPRMDQPADATTQRGDEEGCDEADEPSMWEVDVNSGRQKRLANGADVPKGEVAVFYFGARVSPELTFSPAGDAFAFSQGNILYEFRRDRRKKWKRQRLTKREPKNMAGTEIYDLAYSPDGKKIIFVSERRAGQSYIGIHDIAGQETLYIDPSIFRDMSPVWSPDSKEVAFIRTAGNWPMVYRFTPARESVPWSLVVADADSGAFRTIWKADRGSGSAYEPSAPGFSPIWTPDDEIIFGWEKTGWHLAYAVSAEGGEERLLTPGAGEVTTPILSEDKKKLFFEWNKGDLARNHIWSVTLKGSAKPVAVTSGDGVEVQPKLVGKDRIAYLARYQVDKPPAAIIRNDDGSSRSLSMLNGIEQKTSDAIWKKFVPTEVKYLDAEDGITSAHIFIEPQTPPPSNGYPVIIQVRGGPAWRVYPGMGRFFLGQYLASRGYLFVSINYRGGLGLGLDYRTPEEAGINGGSELLDVAAVVEHLKSRKDIDAEKIGIMGTSYGGHVIGQALSRLPDDFAAGVSQVGVGDWVVELKKDSEDQGWSSRPSRYTRLSERLRIEDLAHQTSPTSRAHNWRAPILFTLGELDRGGHVESAIDLGYRLMEQDVDVEIYIDPAAGHGLFAAPQIVDFFERHLRQ